MIGLGCEKMNGEKAGQSRAGSVEQDLDLEHRCGPYVMSMCVQAWS